MCQQLVKAAKEGRAKAAILFKVEGSQSGTAQTVEAREARVAPPVAKVVPRRVRQAAARAGGGQ
jgi:hypothetical protein